MIFQNAFAVFIIIFGVSACVKESDESNSTEQSTDQSKEGPKSERDLLTYLAQKMGVDDNGDALCESEDIDAAVSEVISEPMDSEGTRSCENVAENPSPQPTDPAEERRPTPQATTTTTSNFSGTSSSFGLSKGDGIKRCYDALCRIFKKGPDVPIPKKPPVQIVLCKDFPTSCTGDGADAARSCAGMRDGATMGPRDRAVKVQQCLAGATKLVKCIDDIMALKPSGCNTLPTGIPRVVYQGNAMKDLAVCTACAAFWRSWDQVESLDR